MIVLPATETIVGIDATNYGCWCVLDFYNLRPDDGVRLVGMQSNLTGFDLSMDAVLSLNKQGYVGCSEFTLDFAQGREGEGGRGREGR